MKGDTRPKCRENDIVQQEANDELLVYDLLNDKAFCLNSMSSKVWQLCDGSRTVDEIGRQIGSDDAAKLALDQMIAENLIEGSASDQRFFSGISRRKALMRIGSASMVAIPVIAALAVPQSIYAQSSLLAIGSPCTANSQCASGCCQASGTGANTCKSGGGNCLP